MPNRLAKETSPYLLQHAGNPVDWYPWSQEALARAQAEDRPILLSIGYSACHWCHVMAHESFENAEIASFMNAHFVNIKVDREERPDLDELYMAATQAMTGRGGWPLNVFLTPERKPFYGGTYFPPEDRGGMAGFPRVLRTVADAYRERREEVERAAEQLTEALSRQTESVGGRAPLAPDVLAHACRALETSFDQENGGFDAAPKFPQSMALELLMRRFHRTEDEAAWRMVERTLEKMARGGIYDQLGGGFHRYATDARWLVPHFEKMLYDNALLSQAYLHGYVLSSRPLFRSAVEETLDYVLREMTDRRGGFYSAQDADTEGVEGKYYVWTAAEIREALGGEDARVFNEYYGATEEGNFEGRNILHVAGELPEEKRGTIERGRALLRARREGRVRPGRDEKVIASWNGLMLASLAEAACVLERADYLTAAQANGSFLLNSMVKKGQLKHTFKDGESKIDGFLPDYALVIEGLLMLHQVTGGGEWLREAFRLAETMIDRFWDDGAGLFYDAKRSDDLVVRPRSIYDGATPSGPSAATMVLLKLAKLADNSDYERIAETALAGIADSLARYSLGFSHWLCALDFHLSEPKEIAVVGPSSDPATSELISTICNTWLPNKVVARYDPDDPKAMKGLALLAGRPMVAGRPTAYVCQRYTCRTPVTDAASLAEQLR
ncbi:MAG: thioredoxin domain-containing protein [Chloroflexi bacterium]|nr:thioredoxin domain-containing protein [Chloroflexota bacterium]